MTLLAPYRTPSSPGLWRLAAGAAYSNLSPKLLQGGIEDGSIPVSLHRIGAKRIRFVNASELIAWVRGTSGAAPEVDLFAGDSA